MFTFSRIPVLVSVIPMVQKSFATTKCLLSCNIPGLVFWNALFCSHSSICKQYFATGKLEQVKLEFWQSVVVGLDAVIAGLTFLLVQTP